MKLFVFLLLISIVLSGCPGKITHEGCDFPYYKFTMPVSFVTGDSIIHVGDTVTVTSQISRFMMDDNSHYTFDFDSIDFRIGSLFEKIDTTINNFNVTDDFIFIFNENNNVIIGNHALKFDYIYSLTDYYIQFKFIPKKKGIYLFQFYSLFSISSNERPIIHAVNSDCQTEEWYPNFKSNNGNNFREILKLSPMNDFNKIYYDNWHTRNNEFGAHCFIVQ